MLVLEYEVVAKTIDKQRFLCLISVIILLFF